MDKKVYIVTNCDNDNATAVFLTEEQAKAIDWFIEWLDLNCVCDLPENSATEI